MKSKKRTREYWQKRFELLEGSMNKKAESSFVDIQEEYIKAQRTIEGKMYAWYQRFANNNKISMAEAKKILKGSDLAEFRWDVKEYIKYGQENALDPIWMKQLENASARVHVSRLESLKIQMQQAVEVLYKNELDDVDKLIRETYTEAYYHTAYEIQQGFEIGWDIAAIDNNQLENIIVKPWTSDNKTFSDRIWGDNKTGLVGSKQTLVNELHTQLTQNVLLGRGPKEAVDELARKFKTSKNNAGRLVMTESAYFSSVSQKDAFKALDVDKYEIVATLDLHTSRICQDLDGIVFKMSEWQIGVTAPPFHVYCRTTTVPYFEDNYTERAARDVDGKTYYVNGNMRYADWYEKHAI